MIKCYYNDKIIMIIQVLESANNMIFSSTLSLLFLQEFNLKFPGKLQRSQSSINCLTVENHIQHDILLKGKCEIPIGNNIITIMNKTFEQVMQSIIFYR